MSRKEEGKGIKDSDSDAHTRGGGRSISYLDSRGVLCTVPVIAMIKQMLMLM